MVRQGGMFWILVASGMCVSICRAGEGDVATLSMPAVRSAVEKAIPLLEAGSAGSADQRTCFTCHSQAVPVFALTEARRRGFPVDADNFDRQVKHTAEHLRRGEDNYRNGQGQGGQVLTAGYALWTLSTADYPADETTAAVAHYLSEYQKDQPHWSHRGRRPPSSGSDFTATAVALRGLRAYGMDEERPEIEKRIGQARAWLLNTTPSDTEDHVFRLFALEQAAVTRSEMDAAVESLLALQRSDGGWAQKPDMQSDAYATGTALVALLTAGQLARDNPQITRGAAYLLRTQLDDGSWHVVTRAEGFQTYFESGFPHEEDQFISIAASGWCTLALLLTLGM